MIRPVELIERKRDGGELSPDEIAELVLAYGRDEVPDYQIAAFCMATFFRGLSAAETSALTEAMVRSGERIDLSSLGRPVADKHSTGGIGDKTTLVLAPLVAACGVPFAKMSGRGLGHTGGTIDKLEAIPGFRVDLTPKELVRQVADVGLAVTGQTAELVPADRRLYALRDVTATVDSIPLIAASVMSKKIAAGADAILLDVKVGSGAFMRTAAAARELAEVMLELGRRAGRRVACLLTDMDQPLGRAVGTALEVREAVETLRGRGPGDLLELVRAAAGQLVALATGARDQAEALRRADTALADGTALACYERWVRAQGGDPRLEVLATAPVVRTLTADRSGVVEAIDAAGLGRVALRLGGGRERKDGAIDHAVGLVCLAKRGDEVEPGAPLVEVHARHETAAENGVAEVATCYRIGRETPEPQPLVLDVLV